MLEINHTLPHIELCFPESHPALIGHFPGNPIVPGTLVLEGIITNLEKSLNGRFRAVGVENVKFHLPLLPDQTLTVQYSNVQPGRIKFSGTIGGRTATSGFISIHSGLENV